MRLVRKKYILSRSVNRKLFSRTICLSCKLIFYAGHIRKNTLINLGTLEIKNLIEVR